jgi:uracil-DNA glycosylase
MQPSCFNSRCKLCPRLTGFLQEVRLTHPEYHARPVPPFGDPHARLLIVGLAPGLHGANASGRPFTGDHAGILLYRVLYKYGFASAPQSSAPDDGLRLHDCRITNAVKCLPPQNKPARSEIQTCNRYLRVELQQMPAKALIVALGHIAHGAVLNALGIKPKLFRFGHGARHELTIGMTLLDSYHCSRYNTQTRRLTPAMFEMIFKKARRQLDTMGNDA